MNYKILIIIFLFLYSCTSNESIKFPKDSIKISDAFSNKGFTLIYNDDLKKKKIVSKKIDERSLIIFQRNLKKDTVVKVTNPINGKSVLAKVGNNSRYPNFYNSVISKRIFDVLELNLNEPYVEIITVSEKSTFLAKKAKIFDEEKEVAAKAPVDGISISDLSVNRKKNKGTEKLQTFRYIIKIADFYYEKTAILMVKRIKDELNINNSKILKISGTNFRVYLGPFDNIKSLKNAFDDINPLNFENIEIIKL